MNILTFDIEEWYTYSQYPKGGEVYYRPIIERYLSELLDVLDENNIQATFFCLGVIARKYPNIIKQIYVRGHEIGCHSDTHEIIINQNEGSFRKDIYKAIDSLEQVIGTKVISYRAPAFSITEKSKWALKILVENGIKYDSSIFPANRRFGGFKSFEDAEPLIFQVGSKELYEFPINYFTLFNKKIMFSGGGYFRIFPLFLTKNLLKRSKYNMMYFHIRDFDKEQKKVYPFFSKNYFLSYYGINSSFDKFQQIIMDFKFISLEQAVSEIDWNNQKKIEFKY